jgi:ElaB/YqjD/DUF883 family membrane-anchored ribosome-binding protein
MKEIIMKVVTPSVEHYPSVEKISDSIGTLKEGVSEFANQVKSEAETTASRMSVTALEFMRSKFTDLRSEFSTDFGKMKSYVQEEPAKGLAIAFATGALVSILLRRS